MKIPQNITELIGKTPIMRLKNYEEAYGLNTQIFAKLEGFNPAGSVKDRVAFKMLSDAKKDGRINKDTVIIEPTSGNTGIGLAAICASWGLKIILTMPETMSLERTKLLKAYGAEIVLTDGKKGMTGAVEEANKLANKYNNSFIPAQFDNMSNPEAHFLSTGPEIWNDTEGKIDVFVAGVGTGGTITGTGKFLKSKNENIKIVAVEPDTSPLLSKGQSGYHKIQGIGANFIPKVLDKNILDEVVTVGEQEAFSEGRILAKTEGILAGISSGAVLFATKKIAENPENTGKNIVVLLPDIGDRYLSTEMFD